MNNDQLEFIYFLLRRGSDFPENNVFQRRFLKKTFYFLGIKQQTNPKHFSGLVSEFCLDCLMAVSHMATFEVSRKSFSHLSSKLGINDRYRASSYVPE